MERDYTHTYWVSILWEVPSGNFFALNKGCPQGPFCLSLEGSCDYYTIWTDQGIMLVDLVFSNVALNKGCPQVHIYG